MSEILIFKAVSSLHRLCFQNRETRHLILTKTKYFFALNIRVINSMGMVGVFKLIDLCLYVRLSLNSIYSEMPFFL